MEAAGKRLNVTAVRRRRRHHRKNAGKASGKTHIPHRTVRVNGSGSFHYVLIVNSDGKEFRCMDPMNFGLACTVI